jgi:hypothetical protein
VPPLLQAYLRLLLDLLDSRQRAAAAAAEVTRLMLASAVAMSRALAGPAGPTDNVGGHAAAAAAELLREASGELLRRAVYAALYPPAALAAGPRASSTALAALFDVVMQAHQSHLHQSHPGDASSLSSSSSHLSEIIESMCEEWLRQQRAQRALEVAVMMSHTLTRALCPHSSGALRRAFVEIKRHLQDS